MDVVIDGIRYTPEVNAPRLGIAIKTHNRPDILAEALTHHREHLPQGAVVWVVDDCSVPPARVPEWCKLFRFDESRGIVAADNKSLELLMAEGVEYLSLWDDDAWPVSDGWADAYMSSPEAHLSYQFEDLAGSRKLRDMKVLYRDDRHVAYSGQRGVMLWYRREAILKVGGFDPIFGRGMYEHSDLANRIHAAGLTSWRYADVTGSNDLIYSADEHEAVERSVPRLERDKLVARNAKVHNERRLAGCCEYVEFREQRNVLMTSLFTGVDDPQRPGVRLPATLDPLQNLLKSLPDEDVVVFADELDTDNVEVVRTPVAINLFFQRHLAAWQYLRDHPEVRFAWCVDGTDVECLNDCWNLEPGKLYIGYEPKVVGDEWMLKNHPAKVAQHFINNHVDDTLLNAGVIGGDRVTLMEFLHEVVRLYFDTEMNVFHGKDDASLGTDMVAVNMAAEHFRVVTGPRVVSLFKHEERNTWSIFRHK